jgi:molecular chaperone GrpE
MAHDRNAEEQLAEDNVTSEKPASRAQNGAEAAQSENPAGQSAPDELTRLQDELRSADDRLLRAQAEFENYRKRVRREMEDERRYAALPLIRDLLSVADNLNRAIESAEQSGSTSGLLEGVKMVAGQLDNVLEQHHCRRIEAEAEPFDPHLHEALAQEPSDEHPPSTVTRVARVGYRLHDRVVRPSQVFVSTGPAENPKSHNP